MARYLAKDKKNGMHQLVLGLTRKMAVMQPDEVRKNVFTPDYNNIDRPTKHSLPLNRLTILTSEWKLG